MLDTQKDAAKVAALVESVIEELFHRFVKTTLRNLNMADKIALLAGNQIDSAIISAAIGQMKPFDHRDTPQV